MDGTGKLAGADEKIAGLFCAAWIIALVLGWHVTAAWAVADASTQFRIFLPPNNDSVGRDVMLVITALSDSTTINVVDDNRDGDDDDSYQNLLLNRGQSLVHFIKDGAVNDDAGGKWDGDYFLINANRPIIVLQATASEWQHDWVPSDNKKMRGRRFYLYIPPAVLAMRDIDVVAYDDDTDITLQRISLYPQLVTGITEVDLKNPVTVLSESLNRGEDLLQIKGLGRQLLQPGATYLLTASRDVTVMMGALTVNMRDGGGYVPSENGTVAGSSFFFFLPGELNKKELRIVSFNDNNIVRLYGWDQGWHQISQWTINGYQHADWVSYGVSYDYYRITSSASMSVFETNWLETTDNAGTADIATFVATENGNGAGQKFVIYIPPPGIETNIAGLRGQFSHLYLFAHRDNTAIRAFDTQTSGTQFQQQFSLSAGEYVDLKIDPTLYNRIRTAAGGAGTIYHPYLTVIADKNIAILNTNFNDNWMTYASSVLVPTPTVRINSSKLLITDADTFTVSVTGSNDEAQDLENSLLQVDLPAGLTIGQVTAPAFLGSCQRTGNQFIWQKFTLASMVVFQVNIPLTLPAGASPVPADGLLELQTLLSGYSLGDQYSSQDGLGIKYVKQLATPVLQSAARATGDTCITVVWQNPVSEPISGFIMRTSSSSAKVTFDTLGMDLRSWRTCRPTDEDYTFEILAFNARQKSPYSNPLTVAALIPNPSENSLIFFPYPNPVDSQHPGPLNFHYQLPEAAEVDLRLVDVAGERRIEKVHRSLQAGAGEMVVDIDRLPPDVYIYIAQFELSGSKQRITRTGKIAIVQ